MSVIKKIKLKYLFNLMFLSILFIGCGGVQPQTVNPNIIKGKKMHNWFYIENLYS